MTQGPDTMVDDAHVLEVLSDRDCRCILAATAERPRTAAELVDRCEIPVSTVYRKIEALTGTGLLAERTRIRPSGPNCSEYALRVGSVRIDLVSARVCDMEQIVDPYERTQAISGHGIDEHGRTSTDGGTDAPEETGSTDDGTDDTHSSG